MEDVTIAATKKHLFFLGIQNEFPNQKLANAEDANAEQKTSESPNSQNFLERSRVFQTPFLWRLYLDPKTIPFKTPKLQEVWFRKTRALRRWGQQLFLPKTLPNLQSKRIWYHSPFFHGKKKNNNMKNMDIVGHQSKTTRHFFLLGIPQNLPYHLHQVFRPLKMTLSLILDLRNQGCPK